MDDHAARWAVAQVAELLAGVVAARQWPSTHLQANVGLMVAIVEAFTAYHITLVVPAGLLGSTHLMAHHITNFGAFNLLLCT